MIEIFDYSDPSRMLTPFTDVTAIGAMVRDVMYGALADFVTRTHLDTLVDFVKVFDRQDETLHARCSITFPTTESDEQQTVLASRLIDLQALLGKTPAFVEGLSREEALRLRNIAEMAWNGGRR